MIGLRDASFELAETHTSEWRPCTQVESLERQCAAYIYQDNGVKAYAAIYAIDETHFRLNLIVASPYRRRSIGTLLLEKVENEARTSSAKYLQSRLWEDEASVAFALSRGFTEVHRMRRMVLRASDFEYRRWATLADKLSVEGYSLTTLKEEFESGVDALKKLCELQLHARQGWPSPDPTQQSKQTTVEDFSVLFSNIKEPERFVIIKSRDDYVAYTSVKEGPGTAVHPEYRNLGLAKYMKTFAIKLGIDAGQSRFATNTANPAMQRVNEQLGYQYSGLSEVRFVKAL